MPRNENAPLPVIRLLYLLACNHQRVNDRVAGHIQVSGIDPFLEKIRLVVFCRAEVPLGKARRQNTVRLLRPRRQHIASAKPRLNMRNRDVVIKRSQRPREDCRRIALHHDNIRILLRQVLINRSNCT